MVALGFAFFVVGAGSVARADDDADTEIAKRHFRAGSAAYAASDYEKALQEFREANLAKRLPALEFNIAKCLDRLERYEDAIAAYQKFSAATHDGKDLAEARDRVRILRERVDERRTLHGPPPAAGSEPSPPGAALVPASAAVTASAEAGRDDAGRRRTKWWALGVVGGALVLGGVAAGIAGAVLYNPGQVAPTDGNVSPGFQSISP